MKKMNSAYRLQLIKEVAMKKRMADSGDPMAHHISQLLDSNTSSSLTAHHRDSHYNGVHYDEQVGGWVSDLWDNQK